jgi:hypothetical protein
MEQEEHLAPFFALNDRSLKITIFGIAESQVIQAIAHAKFRVIEIGCLKCLKDAFVHFDKLGTAENRKALVSGAEITERDTEQPCSIVGGYPFFGPLEMGVHATILIA